MSYLDRKYPDPPLFGETPEETGLIWRVLAECESYLVPAGDKVVRPIFFGKGLDKVAEIEQAAQTFRHELRRIDEGLAASRWLVGDKISAADIGVFPLIQLLLRAASKDAAQPFNLGFAPAWANLSQRRPMGAADRSAAELSAHLPAALATIETLQQFAGRKFCLTLTRR